MPTPTIPNGEEHFFPIIYEGNGAGQRVGRFVSFDDSSGGTIANSCIFNDGDSPYMRRTPSGAGNRKTFTISFWVKRCQLGVLQIICTQGADHNNATVISFDTSNRLKFSHNDSGSATYTVTSNRTLEDTSKFYHILASVDTTQSTASDRVKLYIDGDLITSFATSSYPTQDFDLDFNSTGTIAVSGQIPSGTLFPYDGYITEINLVDGQALLPASFGLTDTSTGRWIPAQVKPHPTTTTTYTVTVVGGNPSNHPYYNVGSTNKFAINGSTATADVDLTLYEGATYRFDQSDSSNSGHPLRFSTVAHGTHASGGTEYTTNVTTVGTPGTSGSYTEITVASSAPDLHYYCSSHNGMGYQASTPIGHGANGFRLTFSDSSSLGADTSGNSNTFTATNLASTDQTTDSPTQNHATFSPSFSSSSMLLSEGNLTVTDNANANYESAYVGMPVQSGKYYFEITIDVAPQFLFLGVNNLEAVTANKNQYPGYADGSASFLFHTTSDKVYYGSNGSNYYSPGSATTLANGDKVGVAYDADTGAFWVAKNNSWLYSGNPSTGANPLFSGITSKELVYFSTASWYSTVKQSYNFGQRSFAYTPPTGFVALQQDNLPETSKGITGMSWTKDRDSGSYNHELYDSSRGAFQEIRTNATTAENTRPQALSKFLKGGFAVGDRTGMNSAGNSYVSWNWTANSGSTSSNSNGSITTTTQVNSDAGFSIIEYTGNATAGATVGHGLSSAPEWFMIKSLSLATNWYVYHKSLGATSGLYLNTTAAAGSGSANAWNQTAPTSSVITLNGSGYGSNNASATYLIYAWHEVDGFSKFGSYEGNSSSDNAFVYLGFKPAVVIFKNIDAGGTNWTIVDNKRDKFNPAGRLLIPNGTDTEYDYTSSYPLDFLSNGFKIRANTTIMGQNTIIYMAFAEHPFVGDGTSPVTAR